MEIPFLPHPSPLPSFSRNPTFLLSNSSQTELALLFFSSIFLRKLFSFIPLLDSHFILEIERFILFLLFLSFFLRRNVSLHTTRFRIISLLKFYFFLFFFSLSEYITFSTASKTFFNLPFFNEILRSNFIYAIFTPFFLLKEDSCLPLNKLKESKTRVSFRIFKRTKHVETKPIREISIQRLKKKERNNFSFR